jgi:glyoxylase-like metal-dependent hydrolase (beta-lactamase superfamily II)
MAGKKIGPYEVIEIGDGAWRIEEDFVRFFLVTGTQSALLVDSGIGGGDVGQVIAELTDLPVKAVVTHADFDHIAGGKKFEKTYLHPSEYESFLRQVPDAQVEALWEGDVIDLGGRSFEVILLPGHTPGSIALLDRDSGVLISGDVFSTVPVYLFGKSRSLPAYIASLEKLEAVYGGAFSELWPSHGSFPLGIDQTARQKAAALRLLAGELEGVPAPDGMPAGTYEYEGASFYY